MEKTWIFKTGDNRVLTIIANKQRNYCLSLNSIIKSTPWKPELVVLLQQAGFIGVVQSKGFPSFPTLHAESSQTHDVGPSLLSFF